MVEFSIIDARNNEARMKIEAMLWIVILILVALFDKGWSIYGLAILVGVLVDQVSDFAPKRA
jgi:hypothetical protein